MERMAEEKGNPVMVRPLVEVPAIRLNLLRDAGLERAFEFLLLLLPAGRCLGAKKAFSLQFFEKSSLKGRQFSLETHMFFHHIFRFMDSRTRILK